MNEYPTTTYVAHTWATGIMDYEPAEIEYVSGFSFIELDNSVNTEMFTTYAGGINFVVYPMGTICLTCDKYVHILIEDKICIDCGGQEDFRKEITDVSYTITGAKPRKMSYSPPWNVSGSISFDFGTEWDNQVFISDDSYLTGTMVRMELT